MAVNKSRKKYQRDYYNYLKLIKYIEKIKDNANKDTKSNSR